MRKVAARDFFGSFCQRFDGCGKSPREVNGYPGRGEQQQQGHQTERRESQQAYLPLPLREVLIFTLRIRKCISSDRITETTRHQNQT